MGNDTQRGNEWIAAYVPRSTCGVGGNKKRTAEKTEKDEKGAKRRK